VCVYLQDIPLRSIAEGRMKDLAAAIRRQEHYSRSRNGLADAAGYVDTIQQGKTDVEQDHVGLRLRGFLNRLQAVPGFADNLPVRLLSKQRASKFSPRREIIHQQYAT